jgi:phosphohistidine swiveling domain-containing protein
MLVVPLAHATSTALTGGKAAALGELIRAGEAVPDGFVVTTEAYRSGVIPRDAVTDLYQSMGLGAVAVRSSATAEDLPGASFAGQHDTVLDVTGPDELVAAIAKCWESARSPRAVAYRRAHDLPEPEMAVIVQRMITATTAGVLFTADPVTGNRTTMLAESATAPGPAPVTVPDSAPVAGSVPAPTAHPGSGVVDGTVPVDRFRPAEGSELHALGERLQQRFATPQDVEWATDADGRLWLLQSRPITTLFPAPPPADGPLTRIYVEFGHVQGMLRPVTPMGMSSLKRMISAMMASLGVEAEIVDIGGRLYGDLSDLARHPAARKRLIKLMAVDFGPRAQAVMEHVLADPRFTPTPNIKINRSTPDFGTAFSAVTGILRALTSPKAARRRVLTAVDRLQQTSIVSFPVLATSDRPDSPHTTSPPVAPPRATDARTTGPHAASLPVAPPRATHSRTAEPHAAPPPIAHPRATDSRTADHGIGPRAGHALLAPTARERLAFVRDDGPDDGAHDLTWPIVAGLLAAAAPGELLKGIATPDEIHTVLGGVPDNVTIEMDLALWQLSQNATAHRDLLLSTPPTELAERYRTGALPPIGLEAFLERYGHRGPAEADLGVPRWSEDPSGVFAAIANYLRVTDPDQAPDARFARAAITGEAALEELSRRAKRRRPIRGRLAVFLLRRARALTGLREYGKFAGLYHLSAVRTQLLIIGSDLVRSGILDAPDDIMFLTLEEAEAATSDNTVTTALDGASPDRAPADSATRDGVARDSTPHEHTPHEHTPRDSAARNSTPHERMPHHSAARDNAAPGSATRANAGYRALVAERRATYLAESRRRHVPVALYSDGTDVETLLAPATSDGDGWRGVGASPGTVTGRARIVHDPATAHIEPGDILVVATTDPAWTPLFLTAGGLVSETGAVMAHGPTVAREYGLPAVISVRDATVLIADGQRITVDGAAGTVRAA